MDIYEEIQGGLQEVEGFGGRKEEDLAQISTNLNNFFINGRLSSTFYS